MQDTFENIEYNSAGTNGLTIYPVKRKDQYLNFFKTQQDFSKEKERTMFINLTEKLIRTSNEYWAYIAHLKNDIPGQDHCAFHANIFDGPKVKIEMHHGPVFTLYDIVEIVLLDFLKKNKKISSFRVFDQVVRDHHKHLINTVPLCVTCHTIAHNKKPGLIKPFISVRHSFGDMVSFIEKYREALTYSHINKIRFYLHLEEYHKQNPHTTEDQVLKESIKSFKNY